MVTIMKIDTKQKIIVTLILVVAIIFVPVYFYVLADDSDANKIEVKSSSIESILDGSDAFDSEIGDGNDTNGNNGIVRTFDSATYTINFRLDAKEGESITPGDVERSVIVDVLLPTSVKAKVSTSATSDIVSLDGDDSVSPSGCDSSEGKKVFNGQYRYAEFIVSGIGIGDSSLNIIVSDIYADNNTEFEPIIIIKEYTDSSKRSIGELSCSELSGDFNSVRSGMYIISTCNNEINESNQCSLSVTGIVRYSVKLFTGEMDASIENRSNKYPIGVLLAIDETGEKGIRGALVPSEVDLNFSSKDTQTDIPIDLSPNGYKSYISYGNQNPKEYTIRTEGSTEMIQLNNGSVTSGSSNNMHISNISSNGILNNHLSNYYYFSTNAFVVTFERQAYDYQDKVFNINCENGGSINISNNYEFNLGNYNSKVELFNTLESDPEPYGTANFNYNQDFYITESFSYTGNGDGLTNLYNYLKIDNNAVDIILNDQNMDYDFNVNTPNRTDQVLFGYGEWNSIFFSPTNAEGCPSEIVNPEDYMNLYGGPCISEVEGMVKWVPMLDDPSLDDGQKQRGPILVKSLVKGDSSNGDLILPGLQGSITLKAKIKDTYTLNGYTYQIVTSAVAEGKGIQRHLGNIVSDGQTTYNNGTEIIMNDGNFSKSIFNNDSIEINRNTCGTEECAISGNTILVSGVKVSKPTVKFYRNNKETSNFYYYPIETRITSNASKNDTGADFYRADIYVEMPSYMEYIDYDNSDTAKSPVEVIPITIDDIAYNMYHYVFNSNEIENGEINNLKVFTNISMDTPNGITPTIYVISDYTIAKDVYNEQEGIDTIYMSSIMPTSYRTTIDNTITIYNGSDITTQGITAPSNIEKNGSYTYKMRAYNNSRNNGNPLSYPNASLYYVVPYRGDSSYSDLSSDFEATGFKIKLNSALPSGYTAYYTKALPSNIINEEIGNSSDIEWTVWNDPTTEKSNITGIKITKNSNFDVDNYFIANEGITITVTPISSEEGDIYYNSFYIISDKPSNYECTENDSACSTTDNKKLYYSSSRTMTSIYNRKVSGFVFEDYDENGIYSQDESKLENIPVSLYRINGDISNIDPKDPATFVSEDDTLIAETVTNSNGEYNFRGISKGNYYVKFKYNDDHYVPTENSVVNPNIPESSSNNSKASILPNTDIAISNVITFAGSSIEFDDMNLGLKIKKEFKVDIKKYITNVQIISDDKIENFDYNNATRVTLNVRNPKNAKIRVKYSFYVENIKYYPGYVGMVVDAMPEGMTFNPNLKENQDWVYYDHNLYYNGLSGTILLPNQKVPFSLVLEAELTKGGNYVNSVSVKDLVLMGDELPKYDFNSLNVSIGGGE